MGFLLALILLFGILIAIVLLRTVLLKPTPAKEAKITLENNERAVEYGKKLAKLVQKETVSSRFEPDRTKFLEFHKILEEMFPNVHKTCEKHVFNGSLLFKWSGKGINEPILFMSHHDVVETNGMIRSPEILMKRAVCGAEAR